MIDFNEKKPTKTAVPNSILVVEDSRIIQNMIRKTLSLTNYQTDSASNGKEALEKIEEKKEGYKAIFLDLLMPHVDGIKAIEKIRNLPSPKSDVTVIAVTGNHSQLPKEEFKALGFNAAVIKPVDCDILINLLERLSDPEADRWLGVISPTGAVDL